MGKIKKKRKGGEIKTMFRDFEVKPLFEDQIHERHQFSLTIEGNEYQGIFKDGDIQWFHPHPVQMLDLVNITAIESKIHHLMADFHQQ